jgi:cell pole-organizing protein PopZ
MAEDPRSPPPVAAGADPSMEDILASIRRILNEDEPGTAPGPAPLPDPNDPLALTEAMLVGEPPKPVAAPPPPPPEPVMAPAVVAPPPPPLPPAQPVTVAAELPSLPTEALLAPAAAAAASAAMGQLMRAVAQDRGAPVYRSGGPSIEDVVREELRPMLKQWLDQNLPPMVERLVRAEIERVVGRALS